MHSIGLIMNYLLDPRIRKKKRVCNYLSQGAKEDEIDVDTQAEISGQYVMC